MQENDFSAEALRKRVDHWMATTGPEDLRKARDEAQKAIANVREAFRIDHNLLRQPMTL